MKGEGAESAEGVERVEYLSYQQLPVPSTQAIARESISLNFNSPEWFIQFQTLTALRQANKHYSAVFLNELLPSFYQHMVGQVDNLRSNNSKEALTLLGQVIQHQPFGAVPVPIAKSIVNSLLNKSVSEKSFLKNLAIKGLNFLPSKWNHGAFDELCSHTQSINGHIAELAMKLVSEMVMQQKQYTADDKFLKNLSGNLNGKRAVNQRKARDILKDLKQRVGEEELEKQILGSEELLQQESITLRRQLKHKEQKSKPTNFREFLKHKKRQA